MEIKKEVIDELMKDYKKPEDVIGENGPTEATDQGVAGAGDERRADASPGIREARSGRVQQRKFAERRDAPRR